MEVYLCGKRESIYAKKDTGGSGRCHIVSQRICKIRCQPVGVCFAERRFTALKNLYARNARGGGVLKSQARSELPPPCRVCHQVRDPGACENKDCRLFGVIGLFPIGTASASVCGK